MQCGGCEGELSCTGRTKPRLCKRNRPTVMAVECGRILTRSVNTTPRRGSQSLMLLQHVPEELHNTLLHVQ